MICRQMGYGLAISYAYTSEKGLQTPEDLPIAKQGPGCHIYSANTMAECGMDKDPVCGHGKDVYVSCRGKSHLAFNPASWHPESVVLESSVMPSLLNWKPRLGLPEESRTSEF